ncbi:MutS family DNA mismatch repair protein [Sinanaerobacter chloroacetimidivorans]|uniref:DNA mismatch repair protein MutS n=1 Tax=Sinanaerobacter chloroacetimidivorans TaxID=2818044 RepID=A0A8J7W5U4_9FIRM|nr:MutS family DNA mismatch repair protein [Sinanaerobacter chloroacetimidivorans]MBR0599628.1 DNA mismatch repair protein MutS [Sinanaerobacter chloroacetimidivorans]
MKDLFEAAICKQKSKFHKNKRLYNLVGYIKLILFIFFAVSIYFVITRQESMVFAAAAVVLLIIQIAAWVYHAILNARVEQSKGIIEINRRHLDRLTGKWTEFPDTGEEFIDAEHPYGCDLDIVGKDSLFQLLNTTHTWHGRRAFAADLLHAAYSKQEIIQRQEAVKELAENKEFTDELEYRFSKIGSDPAAEVLLQELRDAQPFIKKRSLRILLTYGPLIAILLMGLSVIFHWKQLYLLSVILFAVQTLVWLTGMPATYKFIRIVNRLPFRLNAYKEVLELVDTTKFAAEKLKEIQTNLTTSDLSAVQAIKALAKIADKVSVRGVPIVYFLLNVLLLWDYECVFMLEDWKKKYAPYCEKWFLALGELESLSCFATMTKVCSHTCFPHISDTRGLEATELGHPLIPDSVRVTNQIRLNNNIVIISGSNMSGKTTYLRTAGINIVLARAGGPVCAMEMTCSDLHIITSMRIADDLNEGVSTFYAELKRIKGILDNSRNDRNTLFLIDEIFRGTNSVDRLTGARTVITKLNELGAMGMVTTHDLELCELQQAIPRIQNYSFSEYYENGRIYFDYKIQHGKSKTTNARFLMELVGII